MQVWDVNMQDLCSGSLSLEPFKAVVFVGGFSYADVLGSAKGTIAYGDRTRTHTHAGIQKWSTGNGPDTSDV